MGREFSDRNEAELQARPEEVWAAIATGPGIDSWFMGRNEVESGEHGTVRTAFGAYTPELPISAWEPLKHLAYGSQQAEGGRFIAYEFLIEGRGGGSTVLRTVTSGFLPGDDWEAEYDAMRKGGELFFRTLVEYLTHFAGRTATPLTVFGPPVDDWPRAWAELRGALGLAEPVAEGQPVRVALDAVDGTVYFVNPHAIGIRTSDALYRFIQGFHGGWVLCHNVFSDVDAKPAEDAWQTWLTRLSA